MDPIDEIKQKLDIVDLVGSYLETKKAGRNYKANCPFHSEKTPSFMVSPELQIYKCFGCGESGDIFNFHQKIEGIEFGKSLEVLAERVGVKLPERSSDPNAVKKKTIFELNHLASKYFHYILTQHKVGKKALEYLKEGRGLTSKTIKDFNIGYAPESWDSLCKYLLKKDYKDEDILAAGLINKKRRGGYIDKFRGRVMFPLVGFGDKVVGFTGRVLGDGKPKYLNSPETLVFHKSSFLFGLNKAKTVLKNEGVVFVEGQLDVISAHQAGINNVVASSGTSLAVGQLKLLSRYTKDLTFAFDSDIAGDTAVRRAIELSEKQGFNIRVAVIPDKYADLDEFICDKPKKVAEFLSEAIPVFDYYLVSALKRHNVTSPIGKKNAVHELIPIFSKISDPVLRDHYIQKIANEFNVTESVVAQMLSNPQTPEKTYVGDKKKVFEAPPFLKEKSLEEYILALILKSPLDSAQTYLYKLGQKDFISVSLREIFVDLKKYLQDRKKKFDIKSFIKKLEDGNAKIVNELYLWDMGEIEGEQEIEKELSKIFEQLKRRSAKRELKDLSKQIKQAELENDKKLLKELSERFKELSEKLV